MRKLLPLVAPLSLAWLACAARSAAAQALTVREGGPARVERARFRVAVEEGVAQVEVEQFFRNLTDRVQEGVFEFRLPEAAVIGSFSMWMAGKEQHGEVRDAEEARCAYEEIVAKKRDPALLEQVGWREFRVSVFPIPPHDTVRVALRYAHVVRDDLGLETFELPLPVGVGPVGEIAVDATFSAARGLAGLDCPSHADARLVVEGTRATASWSADGVEPTGPFVLRALPRRDGFAATLLAHRPAGAADGWFVARVVPCLAAPRTLPRDLCFVVDRSGSMAGRKLDQAKAALRAGLDSLRPGDRFDLVSFSTEVTSLAQERREAWTRTEPFGLAAARAEIERLDATGGTNLGGALEAALARCALDPACPRDAMRFRAIVLLSDGDPTVGEKDPELLLAGWRERAGATRLFALGVGDGVKDFLLTKLATEGRGDARYVREGDDLEVPIAALLDRVRAPLLLDPEFELEGDGVVLAEREPRRLPDLFQGRPFVVCGRYRGAGRATLTLRGTSGGERIDLACPIELPAMTPSRPHVAQLWAKARVERLQDELRVAGGGQEIRDAIRALGLAHQLVTPYTSFLVLEADAPADRRAVRGADDGSEEQRVPAELEPDVRRDARDVIGVGGGAGHRADESSGSTYRRRAGAKGGGKATEPFIDLAREALFAGQQPGGGFSRDGDMAGAPDVACTALTLLALPGSGNTSKTGRHEQAVRAGLDWLVAQQELQPESERGAIGDPMAAEFLLGHALATQALAEAAVLWRDGYYLLPARRATDLLLASRRPSGGDARGSTPGGQCDVLVTTLATMALLAARDAGIAVDEARLREAVAAIEAHGDAADLEPPTVAACRLLLHALLGDDVATPPLQQAADLVATLPPRLVDGPEGTADLWHALFGSCALFQVGGARWDAWSRALASTIGGRPRVGSNAGSAALPAASQADASTDPGSCELSASPVASRALYTLVLAVHYRCQKLTGMR